MNNSNYSQINKDVGYDMLKVNRLIIQKFPYKQEVEPRLIDYLRIYYTYKLIGTEPCVPLIMQYWIREHDIYNINKYLHRYGITI